MYNQETNTINLDFSSLRDLSTALYGVLTILQLPKVQHISKGAGRSFPIVVEDILDVLLISTFLVYPHWIPKASRVCRVVCID